jgi:hypothetical protein
VAGRKIFRRGSFEKSTDAADASEITKLNRLLIRREKHQEPTSKLQRNFKPQAPKSHCAPQFGGLKLELLWLLELGVWSF